LVTDLAAAAALGLTLGAVTGMPIGVVNVAIVDAATRGEQRFATGIGLGGAIADTVHSSLAFVGVGHVVALDASISRAMAVVAALVIGTYVVLSLRRDESITVPTRRASTGFATGVLLTLPNPAPLAAWAAIASAVWPTIGLGPALVVGASVGIGSAAWFTLLARTISRLPRGGHAARWLPKIALGLLAALAIAGVIRAFVTA
jgi:threonine/homoserine/homoserine lactone efflux protein